MEKVIVNISWSGENYCASVELNGIVVSTNKSLEKLKSEFDSVFKFHVEGCAADGDKLPEYLLSGNYEYKYEYEASALLHSMDGIITRAAIARETGINERQIAHYASGFRNPRPEQRIRIVEGIHSIGQRLMTVV
jgi:hypothetical protein